MSPAENWPIGEIGLLGTRPINTTLGSLELLSRDGFFVAHIQPIEHAPCWRLDLGQQREVMHRVKVHQLAVQCLRKQVVALLGQCAVPCVQGIDHGLGWDVECVGVHGTAI